MLDLVNGPPFGCVLLSKVLFLEESLQINLYLITYKYIAVYFMAYIFTNYSSNKIEEISRYIKQPILTSNLQIFASFFHRFNATLLIKWVVGRFIFFEHKLHYNFELK